MERALCGMQGMSSHCPQVRELLHTFTMQMKRYGVAATATTATTYTPHKLLLLNVSQE
jgi:hypothetical protein